MTKIRTIVSIAGDESIPKGRIFDFSDEKARTWVEGGYAEYLEDERPVATPIERAIVPAETEKAVEIPSPENHDPHPVAKEIIKKRGRKRK